MPTPDFILDLREKIGNDALWLSGVTAVVTRDDQLLCVKRADNGNWTPVTGIIDPGEEPAVAAVREVLEETDIVAQAERLVWVHTLPPVEWANGDKAQFLDLVFRCRYVSGEPHPADGENTHCGWFDRDELPPMKSTHLERIHQALADEPRARFER